MIVHILCIYNSKHLHTWDESIPYVQHRYNRAFHNSIGHHPFHVCLGFQPLAPIDVALLVASSSIKSSQDQTIGDKATKFVEQLIQVDIDGHPPIPLAHDTIFLFWLFLDLKLLEILKP